MPYICEIKPLEKGKSALILDNGEELILYRSELRALSLSGQKELPEELYRKIMDEIIGLRAKKRAMHLLERMDRTEKQIYDKLLQSGYPQECIDNAILYVKKYHYIDDRRYASNYIRCYQDRKSRLRMQQDLLRKGVSRALIEEVLEEEFQADERIQIRSLLEKRGFDATECDEKERQRCYQFLMRRGFKSSDILKVMRDSDNF